MLFVRIPIYYSLLVFYGRDNKLMFMLLRRNSHGLKSVYF